MAKRKQSKKLELTSVAAHFEWDTKRVSLIVSHADSSGVTTRMSIYIPEREDREGLGNILLAAAKEED